MKDISERLYRALWQYQPAPHDPSNVIELDSRNATVAATEGADTISATGTVSSGAGSVTGTATITESADTISATAAVTVTGTLTKTEAADTISATATHPVIGSLTKTESADTISSTGAVAVVGTLAKTEAADTISATGTVAAAGSITGTATITEAADTVSAAGAVTGGEVAAPTMRQGGVGHGNKGRVIQRFYADEGVAEESTFTSRKPPEKPKKRRAALVREIEEVVAVEIANAREMPALTDLMQRLAQNEQYAAFLAERQANERRVRALIAAMIEEAANDDEEAALMLFAA